MDLSYPRVEEQMDRMGGGGEMSEEALGGSQVPRSRTVAVG